MHIYLTSLICQINLDRPLLRAHDGDAGPIGAKLRAWSASITDTRQGVYPGSDQGRRWTHIHDFRTAGIAYGPGSADHKQRALINAERWIVNARVPERLIANKQYISDKSTLSEERYAGPLADPISIRFGRRGRPQQRRSVNRRDQGFPEERLGGPRCRDPAETENRARSTGRKPWSSGR
jgi:hypothetical protein